MTMAKEITAEFGEQLAKEIDAGVCATFGNMFGLKPKIQPYSICNESSVEGDVSGILSLMQERPEGTLIVTFPKATIFKVLEKMYRKPFSSIDQSVKSGVGELTNIIYGVLKTNLNRDGFNLKMAIPSVVLGEAHMVVPLDTRNTMVVPFQTELGSFNVVIAFHGVSQSTVGAA